MTYTINQKQYDVLLGLRHWMAIKAKMIERYPEEYKRESDGIHKTICGLFEEADQNKIPFWVQNIVCGYQDNWRHAAETYLYQDLERRNVNCNSVSCR
jgi:20S proteasome alpha/beta subunit